jgi:hypothetical protein
MYFNPKEVWSWKFCVKKKPSTEIVSARKASEKEPLRVSTISTETVNEIKSIIRRQGMY